MIFSAIGPQYSICKRQTTDKKVGNLAESEHIVHILLPAGSIVAGSLKNRLSPCVQSALKKNQKLKMETIRNPIYDIRHTINDNGVAPSARNIFGLNRKMAIQGISTRRTAYARFGPLRLADNHCTILGL